MVVNPTLIFVPGAWHKASTWDKAQQFKCAIITLPSTTGNPSLHDILGRNPTVRDAIIAETTQERDIVIVVHSYGGAVGQSAVKGLTRPKKNTTVAADESSGHVIGMAFMASGFGITGVSFIEGMGGKPPPSWTTSEESGFAKILMEPRELFYHDLPEEEGRYWVSQIEKQAQRPLMDPEGGVHAYAGWMDVPVWYLITTEDHAFPVQHQHMMAQMGKDAGANVTTREIASSHSPMLSKPKEVADFLVEAVAYFEA